MREKIAEGNLASLRKLRLHSNIGGFSLVEVLVVSVILSIIFAALVMTITAADLSHTISLAKLEAQAELRKDMNWIVKDLRQSNRMQMTVTDNLGNPNQDYGSDIDVNETFSDPQFYICTGYNLTTFSPEYSANQISYIYNNALQQITRSDGLGNSWVFNNITAATFRKLSNWLLRITLTSQITARGAIAPTYTLEEEVFLRSN